MRTYIQNYKVREENYDKLFIFVQGKTNEKARHGVRRDFPHTRRRREDEAKGALRLSVQKTGKAGVSRFPLLIRRAVAEAAERDSLL